jgi:drug/metabolite transporter (DMT)-like permease
MGTRVWAALATVYVVWGSTYLGIMLAIRTVPPFLMSATRFAIAGSLLYAWSIRRGDRQNDQPGRRQWLAATIVGGGLLVAGNGGIAWAEQRVDTGLAALIVAGVPVWFALFDSLLHRRRPSGRVIFGLVVGLAGIAFLVGPSGQVDPIGAAAVLCGSLCWVGGSLYAIRAPLPSRPLVGASMQMLAAGALLTILGIGTGELGELHTPSLESVGALTYLIAIGSLVAFSSYIWLLGNAPPTLVSTYAYVNPVVAVVLGALFLGEAVTPQMLLAGGAIVVAVALIVTARAPAPRVRRLERRPEPALEQAA